MKQRNNLLRRDELLSFTYAVFDFVDLTTEQIQLHRDSHYIFICQKEGKSLIEVDFKQFFLDGIMIGFILPEQVHCYCDLAQAKGKFLIVDKNLISSACSMELQSKQYIGKQFFSEDNITIVLELIGLSEKLVNVDNKEAIFLTGRSSIIAGVIECLTARFKQLNENEITTNMYQYNVITINFKQLVENKYQIVKRVQEYADELHISALYLNEVIKKTLGVTPIEVIHERIITESKRLLYFTTQSNKEIAYALGYDDYAYFSSFFKKRVGISPSKFRSTYQEIQ